MAEFAELASIQALATALLHFLWQGSLVALAAALLMRAARTAAVRYAIGIGALIAMLAAPAITAAMLLNSDSTAAFPSSVDVASTALTREVVDMASPQTPPEGLETFDSRLWPVA